MNPPGLALQGTRSGTLGRAVSWASRRASNTDRRAMYVALAALLLVVAGGGYWVFRSPDAASYVTARVTKGTVARAVTATGSINPVLTITVGTYVSGVIQEIHCDFNTKVRKGQLCAKIDPRPYLTIVEQDRAGVTSARAQLVKDRANLAYAKASVSRLANLLALHAISRDTYEVAASALDQARAQVALDAAVVDQRIAVLTTAEVNLGYTNILSPVDGTVVSRNVTMGQTVAASFQTPTMFLIATDLSQMQVDTNVAEGDIGDIQIGDKAQFRVEAFPNRTFAGAVTQIRQAPQSVQNVVTYDVIIAVSNPQLLLKPGMTATVRIITERRDHVLRVPDMALRYVPGGLSSASEPVGATSPQLFVLRDGRAHRMAVNIGLDDGSNSEITGGGIREGDLVIVSETASVSTGRSRGNATPDLRFR